MLALFVSVYIYTRSTQQNTESCTTMHSQLKYERPKNDMTSDVIFILISIVTYKYNYVVWCFLLSDVTSLALGIW